VFVGLLKKRTPPCPIRVLFRMRLPSLPTNKMLLRTVVMELRTRVWILDKKITIAPVLLRKVLPAPQEEFSVVVPMGMHSNLVTLFSMI